MPRDQAGSAVLGESMVMFGGCARHPDRSCDELGDTWIWNGTTWTQPDSPQSPSSRADALLASDGHVVWLYGGFGPAPVLLDDTWSFDGATWTELATSTSPGNASAAEFQCK
jgi:hypothetical protein